MKKLLLVVIILALIGSLAYALATPVDIVLNTVIVPFSSLTINDGETSAGVVFGQTITIPYLYSGNELVDITITSAGGMKLIHSVVPQATIPYTLEFDYDGAGPQGYVAVRNGVAAPMVDTNGVYNLKGDFTVNVKSGEYMAGRYSDTLTFAVTAR